MAPTLCPLNASIQRFTRSKLSSLSGTVVMTSSFNWLVHTICHAAWSLYIRRLQGKRGGGCSAKLFVTLIRRLLRPCYVRRRARLSLRAAGPLYAQDSAHSAGLAPHN